MNGEETVTIQISCGLLVGSPKWQSYDDWVYEPDKCGWEGEIVVNKWAWENGQLDELPVTCPKCGAVLEDFSHYEPES